MKGNKMSDMATLPQTKGKVSNKIQWKQTWGVLRSSPLINIIASVLIPLIATITCEWIARGTLGEHKQGNGFFQALWKHFPSFLISFLLLVFLYILISQITTLHGLATAVVGLVANVPGVVTYYKMTMRGEPFLPWDLNQISDLMAINDEVSFSIQPSMVVTACLFIVLTVVTCFIKVPSKKTGKAKFRIITASAALVAELILLFGVFLNPAGTKLMGIREDMWMQDRYYRNHGVLTGFLTNLQMLNIQKPNGYSAEAVNALAEQVQKNAEGRSPYYANSYAAVTDTPEQQPDIIFLMAEAFWDVTQLPGVEYDQDVMANIKNLQETSAYGNVYSPSFGGGTCDVEFEALTGFSVEHLPAGSKPYQQYVTQGTFSLPNYLKSTGYETLAVHGYGRKFWNRDKAYPRLGIDEFYASDSFENPDKKRGLISDDAMVDMIIQQYEARQEADAPMFIHAVSMQNHSTYNRDKYPEDQLVNVLQAPDGLSDKTVGQLEDYATGIRDMDAAVGKLTDYFSTVERPTIIVFWGDHLNPLSDGYNIFEKTGFIAEGDTTSPNLRQTPLLVWSNYSDEQVELGTVASYNISPVLMDLYGLEMPMMFEFLAQQLDVMHGRTRGVTVEPDNTFSTEMTEEQQQTFNNHGILQYDFLFGNRSQEDYYQE